MMLLSYEQLATIALNSGYGYFFKRQDPLKLVAASTAAVVGGKIIPGLLDLSLASELSQGYVQTSDIGDGLSYAAIMAAMGANVKTSLQDGALFTLFSVAGSQAESFLGKLM